VKIRLLLAALAALAVVVIGSAGAASADQGHQTKYATITKDCINTLTQQDEGDITYTGPVEVWPPNHKYVSATVTVTDDDMDPDVDPMDGATVAVTGSHDQMVDDTTEMNGSGNTDPATDVVPGAGSGSPTASAVVQFRAERSGHKWTDGGDAWRGRTYTFTVNGTTDDGASTCKPVDFTATVPHDQGNHTGSSTTTSAKKVSAKSRTLRLRRSR
jgi:hypothetical protein